MNDICHGREKNNRILMWSTNGFFFVVFSSLFWVVLPHQNYLFGLEQYFMLNYDLSHIHLCASCWVMGEKTFYLVLWRLLFMFFFHNHWTKSHTVVPLLRWWTIDIFVSISEYSPYSFLRIAIFKLKMKHSCAIKLFTYFLGDAQFRENKF